MGGIFNAIRAVYMYTTLFLLEKEALPVAAMPNLPFDPFPTS